MDSNQTAAPYENLDALDNLYRALRAWTFYPKGHPNCKSRIRQAHASLTAMLDNRDLTLISGRAGFSSIDNESLKSSSRLSSALSYELFIRRIQRITFLHDLYPDDLMALIRLLSLPADEIMQSGGMGGLMAERGIRTIWVNEVDLTAITGKRREIETRGIFPEQLDEIDSLPEIRAEIPEIEEIQLEAELQRLLSRIAATDDDGIYLMLIRQAVACAESLKTTNNLRPIIPLIELLADNAFVGGKSAEITETCRFALELLASGDELLSFLFEQTDPPDQIRQDTLYRILLAGGTAAIRLAVEKVATTESLSVRKGINSMLIRIGEPVLPSFMPMLEDQRWHVIRNLTIIMGEIGSRQAISGLLKCLEHNDLRVVKEAIRSLSKIGGNDAEMAIIDMLHNGDPLLLPQAIASLGGMRSRRAIPQLIKILREKSWLLKKLPIQLNILSTLAMIGDSSVTPYLTEMLTSRHLFCRNRWIQLKTAIAACLGKIGDPRALPTLEGLARNSGELSRACNDAINQIHQAGEDIQ